MSGMSISQLALSQSLLAPPQATLNFSRAHPHLTKVRLRDLGACSAPLRSPVSPIRVPVLRPVQCSASLPPYKGRGIFMDIVLSVRDYELDQYGVVNNAVYSSYCEHAHHELLGSVGVHGHTALRTGEAVALSVLTLKFIAPLRSGDKFVNRVAVTDLSAARFHCEHRFYKLPNLEPILEAKSTLVWLDDNYRPVRIPSHVKDKLVQQPAPSLLHATSSMDYGLNLLTAASSSSSNRRAINNVPS